MSAKSVNILINSAFSKEVQDGHTSEEDSDNEEPVKRNYKSCWCIMIICQN